MQYMQRASSLRILLSAAASSCEKGFLVMRSQVTLHKEIGIQCWSISPGEKKTHPVVGNPLVQSNHVVFVVFFWGGRRVLEHVWFLHLFCY